MVSNAEALAVVQLTAKRLRAASCTLAKDRRAEVRWAVSRAGRYLTGAPDLATAERVLGALEAAGVPPLTRLKLLNAKATTRIAVFLADPDSTRDEDEIADIVEKAWAPR